MSVVQSSETQISNFLSSRTKPLKHIISGTELCRDMYQSQVYHGTRLKVQSAKYHAPRVEENIQSGE